MDVRSREFVIEFHQNFNEVSVNTRNKIKKNKFIK